jgi:endonuclease YncB( thermonuclease family)
MPRTTSAPALFQQSLIQRTLGIALLALLVVLPGTASASEVRGRVVAVADGDTLTVLDGDRVTHKLRIDAIDAPERSQPYGERARQSLAGLAHGRTAHAHCPKIDRYGRAVCRVTVDGVDVGLEQVRRGLAWHYARYAHEQTPLSRAAYAGAEIEARSGRAGLWSAHEPTPPWEYRRSRRGPARS